jgi:mannosyltransferase OCH1-like enzyme
MPEYYNVFVNLKHKIQQIDFFRYLAVYYYGGIYMDLDVENTKCLDDLYYEYPDQCIFPIELQNITDTIISSQGYTNLIGNYAFYSPPKHPFLKAIIDNIVCQRISHENILIAQSENGDPPSQVYVYCTTGPLLVTQTAIEYGVHSIILLSPSPYEPNCFGDYGIHRCYGSWKVASKINTLM